MICAHLSIFPRREITRSNYDTSATFLLNLWNWDDLTTRRQKRKAILMFKALNGLTPAYLQNSFSTRSTQYNLRNVEAKLELPLPRTNYGKRAFCYSGALLWNSLPVSLRQSDSLEYFKREINHEWKIYMKYIIYCTAGMKSNETMLSRSDERKFLLRREAWKFFRTSTEFEPATSRYRCDALTNWAMKPLTLGAGHFWVHNFPW